MLVVVGGATGRFGGIVPMLLERGHAVRALTRDPDAPAAAGLRDLGAEVAAADYDDAESVTAAAIGADAVFASGTAHKAGPDGELRHGRAVADAALAACVPHLVYVSGDGASGDSAVPLFRAKFAVEEHIRRLGIGHTILAPVYLMENLLNPWNRSALSAGVLPSPIAIDRPLVQVATADVVAFAAYALEHPPSKPAGRRVALASDVLTGREAAAELARATGRPFTAERIAPDAVPPGVRLLFEWLEREGHAVDPAKLRRSYPEIPWTGWREWSTSCRV
jgi:uncharacterized protein YbjT (DUF2867 family)